LRPASITRSLMDQRCFTFWVEWNQPPLISSEPMSNFSWRDTDRSLNRLPMSGDWVLIAAPLLTRPADRLASVTVWPALGPLKYLAV